MQSGFTKLNKTGIRPVKQFDQAFFDEFAVAPWFPFFVGSFLVSQALYFNCKSRVTGLLVLLYFSNSVVTGNNGWVRISSGKVAAANANCYESVANLSKKRLWQKVVFSELSFFTEYIWMTASVKYLTNHKVSCQRLIYARIICHLRWLLGLRKLRSSEKIEILQIGLTMRVA